MRCRDRTEDAQTSTLCKVFDAYSSVIYAHSPTHTHTSKLGNYISVRMMSEKPRRVLDEIVVTKHPRGNANAQAIC